MSVAVDTRGLKRVCSECGGRFYDMNKRPIVCPSCETEFTGEMKVKARRGRAAIEEATPAKAKKEGVKVENQEVAEDIEDEDEVLEEEAKELSLDDMDTVVDEKSDNADDDESADLDSIDDDELGDLGKDLGDIDAGIDLDEDDEDLDPDLEDVKAKAASD